jgi:photosystem II stability/assembly factor-like uncharacterized protein
VASGGVILNSDDNGQTWKKINSGVLNDCYKVQFITDSKTGYISGQAPPMLKTEDGGNTWFPLAWPPSPLYASAFTNTYFVSDSRHSTGDKQYSDKFERHLLLENRYAR